MVVVEVEVELEVFALDTLMDWLRIMVWMVYAQGMDVVVPREVIVVVIRHGRAQGDALPVGGDVEPLEMTRKCFLKRPPCSKSVFKRFRVFLEKTKVFERSFLENVVKYVNYSIGIRLLLFRTRI